MADDPKKLEDKGERLPPACVNCRRLEALVNKIIIAAINSIAALHYRPPTGITREQELKIYEAATAAFMQTLTTEGLLPAPRAKKVELGIVQ